MLELPFSKYSGCGNDFILFDNRAEKWPGAHSTLVKKLCNRRLGIGADGVILLENETSPADYRMRIFNADGSEAEMCGNGLRCLGLFLKELGINGNRFVIRVMGRDYSVKIEVGAVEIQMVPPTDIQWNTQVSLNGEIFNGDYLDTGVPHYVLFTKDVESIMVETLGRSLRHHPQFDPRGANVDFAALSKDNILVIRTYERGVEAETLACGTGAAAAAIAAAKRFALPNPITVKTRSGENLEFRVVFDKDKDVVTTVIMRGGAVKSFEGRVKVP